MTERQIRAIFQHKRDTKGVLQSPVVLPASDKGKVRQAAKFPASLEEELRQILPLAKVVTNYEEMVRAIHERWKSGQRNGGHS